VHRIAVLTEQEPLGTWLEAQISRFCREKGLFTQIRQYRDQESFFKAVQLAGVSHTVIALQGIAGLNAAEHLRTLCPACRSIWCSDMDFSLHAFRLRVDYFLLEPVTEEALRQGLAIWFEEKMPLYRF
jgi:hypothetical protein